MMNKLGYEFYNRNSVDVAIDLLGKKFIFKNFCGIIYETEAYGGLDDPASHAFNGIKNRSRIMFGPPGNIYIYMIYGMYHCLNIVTDIDGIAGAVLIRGMIINDLNLDGPGKICKYLGITKEYNNTNIIDNSLIYLEHGISISQYTSTQRIGITKGKEKLWRFVALDLIKNQIQ